jgi:hypothetical protein
MAIDSGKICNIFCFLASNVLSATTFLSTFLCLYALKDEQVWLRTGSKEFLEGVIKRDGWLLKKNSCEGDRMG